MFRAPLLNARDRALGTGEHVLCSAGGTCLLSKGKKKIQGNPPVSVCEQSQIQMTEMLVKYFFTNKNISNPYCALYSEQSPKQNSL